MSVSSRKTQVGRRVHDVGTAIRAAGYGPVIRAGRVQARSSEQPGLAVYPSRRVGARPPSRRLAGPSELRVGPVIEPPGQAGTIRARRVGPVIERPGPTSRPAIRAAGLGRYLSRWVGPLSEPPGWAAIRAAGLGRLSEPPGWAGSSEPSRVGPLSEPPGWADRDSEPLGWAVYPSRWGLGRPSEAAGLARSRAGLGRSSGASGWPGGGLALVGRPRCWLGPVAGELAGLSRGVGLARSRVGVGWSSEIGLAGPGGVGRTVRGVGLARWPHAAWRILPSVGGGRGKDPRRSADLGRDVGFGRRWSVELPSGASGGGVGARVAPSSSARARSRAPQAVGRAGERPVGVGGVRPGRPISAERRVGLGGVPRGSAELECQAGLGGGDVGRSG